MPTTALTIAAWAVLLIATFLLLRALFHDRPRGRKRCPNCWYDLSASTSLQCPECGRIAKSPDHLLHTRRHWLRAVISTLVIAGALITLNWTSFAEHDWMSHVPNSVLLWQAERTRNIRDRWWKELFRRTDGEFIAGQVFNWDELDTPVRPKSRLIDRPFADLLAKMLESDLSRPDRNNLAYRLRSVTYTLPSERVEHLVDDLIATNDMALIASAVSYLNALPADRLSGSIARVLPLMSDQSRVYVSYAIPDVVETHEGIAELLLKADPRDPRVLTITTALLESAPSTQVRALVHRVLIRLGPIASPLLPRILPPTRFDNTGSYDALQAYAYLCVENRHGTPHDVLLYILTTTDDPVAKQWQLRAFAIPELAAEQPPAKGNWPTLRAALGDANHVVRQAAARTLIQHHQYEDDARALLTQDAANTDPYIAHAAKAIIKELK